MELTFKQKIIVFSVMLAVFLLSVFIKYGINTAGNEEEYSADSELTYDDQVQYQDNDAAAEIEEELIIIDVEGAVTYPGIVKIESGSRVYEAVEEAGGLLGTADTKYVNLAEEVTDGSIVYIPFKGETQQEAAATETASKININTADKNKLMELPGIGETYAAAIIEYRTNNGNFKKTDDIMNVSGIGETKYNNIKELISVY